MSLKKALATIVSLSLTFAAVPAIHAVPHDVDNYFVAKGQKFFQNSAGTPLNTTNDVPYRFSASVDPVSTGTVTSASVKAPNGSSQTLSNIDSGFSAERQFTTKTLLDRAFGAGNYTFTIATQNQGTAHPALPLSADAYPPTPRLANWTDAQDVEADQPFTFTWDVFTAGTTNDVIILDVSDSGGNTVFSSPFLLESDALNGAATSVTMPSNTLAWGTTYTGRLSFFKRTALNTNAYPHVPGVAGYFKQTQFPVVTPAAPPAAGRIEFSASNFLFSEGAGIVPILITRSGTSGSVTVDFTTSDGTAIGGIDFTGLVGTVTFVDGQSTATGLVAIVDNSMLNSNKTLNVHLSNVTGGAVIGTRSDAVVTIKENESIALGTFGFSKVVNTATEIGKTVTLTISRTGGSSGTVSVDFYTEDGAATAGTDYTATNGTLVFGPGKTSKTITIPILNDTLSEVPEAFFVYLQNITSPAILGSNYMARVNITSDDVAGSMAFSSATYAVSEKGTNLVVTVKRTGGTASAVSIGFSTADGTAVAGTDYVATNGSVTFAAKETTKTITIPIINNASPDGNRQFTIGLSHAAGGGTIGTINRATITILDDEPSLAFDTAAYVVSESSASVIVKVVRSGPTTTAASVNYTTVNGSAVAGSDYTTTSGTLQFPAGTSSKTITIPLLKDTVVEGTENFSVHLFNPSGVQLGNVSDATVTINDDDVAGSFSFSAATYSGTEGGTANVVVKRTGGNASGITVQFTMSGGTAVSGGDYTDATQTLTFGATETSKTIAVHLTQDITTEATETVNLFLTSPSNGGTIGTQGTAVLNIGNKPDPNAVPVSGAPFMKGTVGGAAFTAISSSVIGATNGTAFTINGVWTSGSGTGTISHLLTIVVNPLGLGVVTMDNNGNHGLFTLINGGLSGSHSYAVADGNDTQGSSGTVTVDGIDLPNHRISGRFTFHARENTGNVPGAFIDITGSFRENLP